MDIGAFEARQASAPVVPAASTAGLVLLAALLAVLGLAYLSNVA